jgi:hypothetical protein
MADIMFCSSHCHMNFCSSDCDIVRLWPSNYDEGFFFVTLWHWNRFVSLIMGYVLHIVMLGNFHLIAMLVYVCHITTLS